MIGICVQHDKGYNDLLRDQLFLLVKATDGEINVFSRDTPDNETGVYDGIPYTNVNNADDLPVEPKLVVVSALDGVYIKGDQNLTDYVHPNSAIYFFGDDHHHLTQEIIGDRTDYDKVYIPLSENIWSTQAIGMVIYDRMVKNLNT